MIDMIPRHQLGYVLPILVGDYIHYQFYRTCPETCFLVCKPLDLRSFSRSGAEDALREFWSAIDFLHARGVDRITQGGIPISAYVGRPRMLDMIAEAERRTGVPCSADFEESIEAFHALGVTKVAIAAKWDDELIARMTDYLAHAGIVVVGHCGEAHTAAQVVAIAPQDGVNLAVALGRRALAEHGEAHGLLLGGGAWLSSQAVPILEAEFAKPVVTNPVASYWAALRQFGVAAKPGHGRLLDSLST